MKHLLIIAALAALLWAGPALAGADAWQSCASTHEGGRDLPADARFIAPHDRIGVCYDTDGTTDSPILSVGACDHLDALVFNMTDGTTDDVALQIRSCPTATASSTTCWAVENVTLNGDASSDTEAIYGFPAMWIYVDMITNTNSDDVRVAIRCNED